MGKRRIDRMVHPHRIKNQYLLMQLASIVRLGSVNVSATVWVEAWRLAGREVGDVFFLHQDVLLDYGFVSITKEQISTSLAEIVNDIDIDTDVQFSITDAGREFLERYG